MNGQLCGGQLFALRCNEMLGGGVIGLSGYRVISKGEKVKRREKTKERRNREWVGGRIKKA